ncbi:hypothetical protein HMPREF1222_02398 [Treponema vincentii F0403]|uniref:L-serine ammonia-lyase n=1 Tax=Treponema vincentii F0403 TaxID=1125702 RepID=S3M9Q5_9SPIR|nr:hypothetical protein HMPREF1222_02398 [Treponema vincentii F0403]
MLSYESISELYKTAEEQHKRIREIVLEDQAVQLEQPEEALIRQMDENLTVMLEAIDNGSKQGVKSTSGLTGGDAYTLKQTIEAGKHLCGDLMSNAIQMAMAVSEINAAMGKIVAAPTAGSCGILPGALGALIKVRGIPREEVVLSMFTAGCYRHGSCKYGFNRGCFGRLSGRVRHRVRYGRSLHCGTLRRHTGNGSACRRNYAQVHLRTCVRPRRRFSGNTMY